MSLGPDIIRALTPISLAAEQSQCLRGVSPDGGDRGDNAKVTMQTRVAVRDKEPHRFQVVPLREVLKHPLPDSPPRVMKPSGLVPPQVRSSNRKLAVHVDTNTSPPKGKKHPPRITSKSAISRPVLQSRDLNRKSPSATHRKAESLEMSIVQEISAPGLNSTSKPLIPSHGYSNSLNLYSFSLKPFRAASGESGSDSGALNKSTLAELRGRKVENENVGTYPLEPITPNPSEPIAVMLPTQNVRETVNEPCPCPKQQSEVIRNANSDGAYYRSGGPPNLRSGCSNSRKRHAIYAFPENLPLISGDNFVGDRDSPQSSESTGGSEAQVSIPLLSSCGYDDPTFKSSSLSAPQSRLSSARTSSNLRYYTIQPLDIAPRPHLVPLFYGPILPHEIVRQLLNDLDNAIEIWDVLNL